MRNEPTSLSSCLMSNVICFMTRRGASSESFMINVETDLGPLVSLLLNSLLLRSLHSGVNVIEAIDLD